MKILGNIATEIAVKIGIEQAQYYYRLMKKIISCFKRKGTELDFSIDSVEHADIITEEQTPKNTECEYKIVFYKNVNYVLDRKYIIRY